MSWNYFFEASVLYLIDNGKNIKTCQNKHADVLRFLFNESPLIIEKDLERVSRPHLL